MYDKQKMQDLTISEQKLIKEYQNLWVNGDIANLKNFVTKYPKMKYKLFNAENWNRLINLINDSTTASAYVSGTIYKMYDMVTSGGYIYASKSDNNTETPTSTSILWQQLYPESEAHGATTDSLVGLWENDYGLLKTASENFKFVGEWSASNSYKKGNLVTSGEYNSYFCVQDTTSETNDLSNTDYWLPAQTMLESNGIQVAETAPTNMSVGDIYLKILN